MTPAEASNPLTDFTEEKKVVKTKCQAILSLIGHFQYNKKHIQRAHLIRALVKKPDANSDIKSINEKDIIDPLPVLDEIAPKIMFDSVANLDKQLIKLRKLGLITNQYMRGYPRLILTDKGRMFYFSVIYSSFIFNVTTGLSNKFY